MSLTAVPSETGPSGGASALTEIFRSESDPLDAFAPENEIRYKTQRRPASTGPGALLMLLVAGVIGGILALTYMAIRRAPASPVAPTAAPATLAADTGQAQFDSRPSGADVLIDGIVRGKTPLKLSLPIGSHTLEIAGEAGRRSLPLTIEAGVLVSQYVELLSVTEGATGRLDITSDPPGAQVRVDGALRGVTPLTLEAQEPREHIVALTRGGSTIYRTVKVSPGATASVFASLGAAASTPGAVGGFISLNTPIELQVFEDGRLIGTTRTERLMVPTGRHQLELVSAPFEFRTTMTVTVEPGKVAAPIVPIPNGSLSVNALPWAEVTVDGRPVGTTPLANVSVAIGNHEVVWRHPELGERRQMVAVTAQTPVRVGVSFAP